MPRSAAGTFNATAAALVHNQWSRELRQTSVSAWLPALIALSVTLPPWLADRT